MCLRDCVTYGIHADEMLVRPKGTFWKMESLHVTSPSASFWCFIILRILDEIHIPRKDHPKNHGCCVGIFKYPPKGPRNMIIVHIPNSNHQFWAFPTVNLFLNHSHMSYVYDHWRYRNSEGLIVHGRQASHQSSQQLLAFELQNYCKVGKFWICCRLEAVKVFLFLKRFQPNFSAHQKQFMELWKIVFVWRIDSQHLAAPLCSSLLSLPYHHYLHML